MSIKKLLDLKMETQNLRNKLLEEVTKIPDDKIPEIFDFLYHFRLGLGVKKSNPKRILQLAGSWGDMSELEFKDFLDDVQNRRVRAFLSRSSREASID